MNSKQLLLRNRFQWIPVAALVVAVSCFSGCATLPSLPAFPSLPSLQQQPPVADAKQDPSAELYRVEMQRDFQEPIHFVGEIDGDLTVQTALERSGAIEKYKNMDIMVLRVIKETGRGFRMPANYDSRQKSVTPETNYALHHRDRILVMPNSKSVLDQVVKSVANR